MSCYEACLVASFPTSWNADSLLILACNFLDSKGLEQEFIQFLQDASDRERQEISPKDISGTGEDWELEARKHDARMGNKSAHMMKMELQARFGNSHVGIINTIKNTRSVTLTDAIKLAHKEMTDADPNEPT